MGIITPSGDLEADGGSASSAEDRTEESVEGDEEKSRCFERSEPRLKEIEYKKALEDILEPPTPPNLISQIVKEGFVQAPDRAPTNVVIMSEILPTWLTAADTWGSKHLFLYCKKEWDWYRENLDLLTPLSVSPTVAGLAKAPWIKDHLNTVLLVQGSSSFCKTMIKGLVTLGLTESNKIIVTTNQRCSGLALKFKFVRLNHANVGGASSTTTSIGFSPGCGIFDKIDFAKGIECGVKEHTYPILPGSTCTTPMFQGIKNHQDKGLLSSDAHHALSDVVNREFAVPSVFSKTGWVRRTLTPPEILSVIDTPGEIIKSIDRKRSLVEEGKFKEMIPLVVPVKTLQEVTRILFKFDKPIEKRHIIPIYDVMRLAPEISGIPHIYDEINQSKVAKNDNAACDATMWNEAAFERPTTLDEVDEIVFKIVGYDKKNLEAEKAALLIMETFRKGEKRQYKKNVTSSFQRYMNTKHENKAYGQDWIEEMKTSIKTFQEQRDFDEGLKAIKCASLASFWEWDEGSFPHFWRWQPEIHHDLRDGTPLWVHESKLKNCTKKPQRMPREPNIVALMVEKISKVLSRGYISALLNGSIESLTHYFAVPKGDNDIRMVYDLTASGFNDALWAPRFWMPSILNVVDCATDASWYGDVDVGEMFLNFPLDINMRKFCGVDLSWMQEDGKTLWKCWNRMAMGMKPSPFMTIRLLMWMMEIVIGDRSERQNPFRWDHVVLNLPGTVTYDPTKPRVYKWNTLSKSIACDCKFFCDDFRVIGPSEATTKRATHKLETTMSYLGIQDATRKRRKISQRPGEWTGSITISIKDVGLFVTVSQNKWERAKEILDRWKSKFLESDEPSLNHKELEKDLGFLVHLAMTYANIKPFLRGFYLTLNSWRTGRDKAGWKLSNQAHQLFIQLGRRNEEDDYFENFKRNDDEAPKIVKAVPSMKEHVNILVEMFSPEKPVLRLMRGSSIVEAMYIFGDASGLGFGSSWHMGNQINFRYGIWGLGSEDTSSNYRELRNLVETLESNGEKEILKGKEIFLFTDNTTAENIAQKGSSTSPLLFELIVRLYKLPMKYHCSVQVIHVAGTRMIKQGTDGLSRGDLLEGVLKGKAMLSFVPLHLGANDVESSLKTWVNSWACKLGRQEVEWLEPEDWFDRGHDINGFRKNIDGRTVPSYQHGTFVWTPPPAAARVALEELRQARHKRQRSAHIFIVPSLMTLEWSGQLYKTADLILKLPEKSKIWPSKNHESLTLAICFPFMCREPWQLKGQPIMGRMARELCSLFETDSSTVGYILSQLCDTTTRLDKMPVGRLRKVLSGRWFPAIPNQQTGQ